MIGNWEKGQEATGVEVLIPSVDFILGSIELEHIKAIDGCILAATLKDDCKLAVLEIKSGIEVCILIASANDDYKSVALENKSGIDICMLSANVNDV